MKYFILSSFFILTSNVISAQIPTIYANGGESRVNWDEIMSEYEDPNYEGPTFWEVCIMVPENAYASSTLRPQGRYNYNAKNLKDYDPNTAWVEGKSDYGIGEYFEVDYLSASVNTLIYNGYQRSYTSWKNNSRVKKFKIYGDKNPICYLVLSDKMGGQSFKIPENNYEIFRFEIVSVYEGDKWKDVAISEIHQRGCCFNSNTKILNLESHRSIHQIQTGNEIYSLDLKTDEMKISKVTQSAKQTHHTLLKASTEDHTVELTPSHPLHIKDHGLVSLHALKKAYKFADYQELIGEIEILVWDNEKQKSEYQKLVQIEKINGEFETYTILQLEKGKTYIANGFVTSVY